MFFNTYLNMYHRIYETILNNTHQYATYNNTKQDKIIQLIAK